MFIAAKLRFQDRSDKAYLYFLVACNVIPEHDRSGQDANSTFFDNLKERPERQ